jgi:N-acetylneuraminate synthase
MFWGIKSRFHDLENIIKELNPKAVEFHLTDNDVMNEKLKGSFYSLWYSVHLPEYWNQVLIDPCNFENLKTNLEIYKLCLDKSLEISDCFLRKGKLIAVLHPGGASVDKLPETMWQGDIEYPVRYYKRNLYRKFEAFVNYLEMLPNVKSNVEILVENMPPLPWFYGGQYYSNIFCDPAEIKDYCERTGRKLCFDVSHMGLYCNYVKSSLLDAVKLLKPYMKQIHIADASGTDGEGISIGKGNINFTEIMKEIKDIDVAVIPEQMWGHKNNFEEFKKTMTICGNL